MGDIIRFPTKYADDLEPKQVIAHVPCEELCELMVIGVKSEDGGLYAAGTTSDLAKILLLHKRLEVWINDNLLNVQ